MTLGTMVLNIGIVAIFLTGMIAFLLKQREHIVMSFLQTFCGSLLVFSGWVKAVDPLGTAYKMEQYFTEFTYAFEGTWMGFVAPLFPLLSSYAVAFSVVMIVIELVLGINLIFGTRNKTTAWAFFLMTLFFTALTGFTFLTGYVPGDVNFFSFSQWGPYAESNMRVTDCGCFGDFIKLKPKVSFFKDVVLLIPALLFILYNSRMHKLFTPALRDVLAGVTTVTVLIYAMSNFVWDIPHVDFRPFKVGADVANIYEAEQEAAGNVKVEAWKIKNKENGEIVELSNEVFMSEWSKKYKKSDWEVVEQIKSEPAMAITKISDFEFVDAEGYAVSEDLLQDEGTTVMIVCPKLKGDYATRSITVVDTIYVSDTTVIEDSDSMMVVQRVDRVDERQVEEGYYIWEEAFDEAFREVVNPFIKEAQAAGWQAMGVAGGAGSTVLRQLEADLDCTYSFYEADDILLKTIVRSNPGIVIWRSGKIVGKWHYKKLPSFHEVNDQLGVN